MSSFDLLAGAIWPQAGQWIPDAVLSVRRGKVVSIRSGQNLRARVPVLDFRPWMVVPGFVNAHVHLELTGLELLRPAAGKLEHWIGELIERRQAGFFPPARRAAREGIRRCLATGTTTVGEIEASGASYEELRRSALRAVVFREFLGLNPGHAAAIARDAKKSLARRSSATLRLGLSPHAPYSLSPELWRFVSTISRRQDLPMAIHLAESKGERELLENGTGGLVQALRSAGRLPWNWREPGLGPLALAAKHGLLRKRTLLVHGNDLRPKELDRVRAAGCSLVFCPGSHRFFRYPCYPLRAIMQRRIPLALGTDSLASNEDLSMLREMALLRRKHPEVSGEAALDMATLGGARALGWENRIGSLEKGKEADLAVLRLRPLGSKSKTLDRIASAQPEVLASFVAGRRAFPASRPVL